MKERGRIAALLSVAALAALSSMAPTGVASAESDADPDVAATGGQVVAWGRSLDWAYNAQIVPSGLPDGVRAIDVSAGSLNVVAALLSDGRIARANFHNTGEDWLYLEAPDGLRYTDVAVHDRDVFMLRSDGRLFHGSPDNELVPPAGTQVVAVEGPWNGLLSDGSIYTWSGYAPCQDGHRPAAGLAYTDLADASPFAEDWAALRSDGAIVACIDEDVQVTPPPAGARFSKVAKSGSTVVAATSDGRLVVVSGTLTVPTVPSGRTIVDLSLDSGTGAAVLDDGTLLTWGPEPNSTPPVLPAGHPGFVAVDVYDHGPSWALLRGDPLHVELAAEARPIGDRPRRVTDDLVLDLAVASGGVPVDGYARVNVVRPDGTTDPVAGTEVLDGTATLHVSRERLGQVGTHQVTVTFSGSPWATTVTSLDVDLAEPAPMELTVTGSTTWRATAASPLQFDVSSADGSPIWHGISSQSATPGTYSVGGGSMGHDSFIGDLAPGTYVVHYQYMSDLDYETVEWSSEVTVLEPAASVTTATAPTTWSYGAGPAVVPVSVSAEELTARGYVSLKIDGTEVDARALEGGRAELSLTGYVAAQHLLPGGHTIEVAYNGGYGAHPSTWTDTVLVTPGRFQAPRPTIVGEATFGSVLTVDLGTWDPKPTSMTYRWTADGVTIPGETYGYLSVGTGLKGKRIAVTVSGSREHYATTTVTSLRTGPVGHPARLLERAGRPERAQAWVRMTGQ